MSKIVLGYGRHFVFILLMVFSSIIHAQEVRFWQNHQLANRVFINLKEIAQHQQSYRPIAISQAQKKVTPTMVYKSAYDLLHQVIIWSESQGYEYRIPPAISLSKNDRKTPRDIYVVLTEINKITEKIRLNVIGAKWDPDESFDPLVTPQEVDKLIKKSSKLVSVMP